MLLADAVTVAVVSLPLPYALQVQDAYSRYLANFPPLANRPEARESHLPPRVASSHFSFYIIIFWGLKGKTQLTCKRH